MGWAKQISFAALILAVAVPVLAIEVVSEGRDKKKEECRSFQLKRELDIFKDPSLFLPAVAILYSDPKLGWEKLNEESPLLTSVKGTIEMQLFPERDFRGFISIAAVSRVYENLEPRLRVRVPEKPPKIIPIRICPGAGDPYSDTLGFILESDLKLAQTEKPDSSKRRSLPPSVYPNPVPEYLP